MIFTGDIALPSFSIKLPDTLPQSVTWVGNLEGSVVNRECENKVTKGVYNDYEAVKELLQHIPFKAFSLANNHLLDFGAVNDSITRLQSLEVPSIGAGNIREASKSLVVVDDDNLAYRILAFGWKNIQCPQATEKRDGVNPLTKKHVLSTVKAALKNPEPVICFMHWDYELEKYPMPMDRCLAHELIDLGVSAIVGCHGHRVQQVEIYKNRPIVYGLGNFLFRQGVYFGGKLKYPALSSEEWAFEIKRNECFYIHRFEYDNSKHELKYVEAIELSNQQFYGKAEYNDFSNEEYLDFFKKNRKVKKLLPVFTHKEKTFSYWSKSEWIKLRGWLLDIAMNLNLKSANRG